MLLTQGAEQELGSSSGFPNWVVGTQAPGTSFAASDDVQSQETASVASWPEQGTPTRDAGITRGRQTFSATMPIPTSIIFSVVLWLTHSFTNVILFYLLKHYLFIF